jgi:sugar O-acyltransferase (sialic acid O-acetyltransferase NeuD family)
MPPETTLSDPSVIFLGAGGHARVLQELLLLQGRTVSGYLAPAADSRLVGVEWLGNDDALDDIDPATVVLVNGIGSIRADGRRRSAYDAAVASGFRFLPISDSSAIVRPSAAIGAGVQILAGVVVNSNARVGANTILNTGSIIEHDTVIGASVHISPGAVLGGGVRIGDGSHIGLGSRVLQGVSIGSECTIGAGAVVTRNLEDGVVAVGVPAVARPRRAAN